MSVLIEDYIPVVKYQGLNTDKNVVIGGNLTVSGTTTIAAQTLTNLTTTGNTVLGNATTDTVTISGPVDIGTNVTLVKEVNHTVSVSTTTTANTAGGNLTVSAATGAGTGAGGVMLVTGGDSGTGATGNGGAAGIRGGAATSTNGNGGAAVATGGVGIGTGTGGAATITGGQGGATGAGGVASLVGGAGGATSGVGANALVTGGAGTAGNANGGDVILTGGAQHGSGRPGFIYSRSREVVNQQAPTAKTTDSTLTVQDLGPGIITINQAAGGTSAQQLPAAADMDTGLPNMTTNDAIDVIIINTSTVDAEDASVTTNTGWTLVGSMDFHAYSAAGSLNSSGILRLRKTGTAAWTAYRIA